MSIKLLLLYCGLLLMLLRIFEALNLMQVYKIKNKTKTLMAVIIGNNMLVMKPNNIFHTFEKLNFENLVANL